MVSVVYDLEFCGSLEEGASSCRIWEIAGVIVSGERRGEVFSQVVQMPLTVRGKPIKQYPGYQQIDRNFLKRHRARPISHVLKDFFLWTGPCILISHGNFRADKPVLEHAIKRCGLHPPVWFIDTLVAFRDFWPGRHSYTLSSFTGHTTHRALEDALNLANLLQYFKVPLPIACPIFQTPLRTLKGCGRRTEEVLNKRQISSIEGLARRYRISAHPSPFNDRLVCPRLGPGVR